MRKLWSCLFYALCVFTVAFSLYWMSLPRLTPRAGQREEAPASSVRGSASVPQSDTGPAQFYLCDEGGRVAVYRCGADGAPLRREILTTIYVNLLPEGDALRIKHGLTVQGEQALDRLLEDLGA